MTWIKASRLEALQDSLAESKARVAFLEGRQAEIERTVRSLEEEIRRLTSQNQSLFSAQNAQRALSVQLNSIKDVDIFEDEDQDAVAKLHEEYKDNPGEL
jgi:chromosome segregation ATPase